MIIKWFGVGDLTALNHIGLIIRRNQAVNHRGENVYLPNVDRMRLPILFLAGGRNRIFLPESSERTMRWLEAANGSSLYRRVYLPEYAHLDGFVGRNAERDVYPLIVDHLDAHRDHSVSSASG
jgi:cholesterol oxidase